MGKSQKEKNHFKKIIFLSVLQKLISITQTPNMLTVKFFKDSDLKIIELSQNSFPKLILADLKH